MENCQTHQMFLHQYFLYKIGEINNAEQIFKETVRRFDNSHLFWTAHGLPLTEDGEDILFTYADGWDLNELHENIREAIREHCIVFDGESEV